MLNYWNHLIENENINDYTSSWDQYMSRSSAFFSPTSTCNLEIPFISNYVNLINVLLLGLFLLILGLTVPQKPKFIKFLHLIGAVYTAILLFITPYNTSVKHFITFNPREKEVNAEVSDNIVENLKVDHSNLMVDINNLYDFAEFIGQRISYSQMYYPVFTSYTLLFFMVSSFAVVCLLLGVSDKFYSFENNKMEFLLLVVFIYIGAVWLINSQDFFHVLILLECIAFSSYILVGFERKNKFSSSSGIKYLILGSIPGGLFVLGITLLYKNYGSFVLSFLDLLITDINGLLKDFNLFNVDVVKWAEEKNDYVVYDITKFLYYKSIFLSTYVAIILIFINLLFKLTAAPMHLWAPSVYGGSPLGTATFLSIFSKLTIIFLSIYLYINVFSIFSDIMSTLLIFSGILSIVCGILGAFSEKLIKKFFVYSSMGHVGFMLLGISSGMSLYTDNGFRSTIDYLIIYVMSAYIMWFILMYLTRKTTHLTNLKALSVNHPVLSFIFSVTLFSLSGLPPLAGFFVKFEIFYSILNTGNYYLVLLLFILTVFSFFYYLRIIKILYFENNTLYIKNKSEDVWKLRVISILFHFILFFVIFVSKPILYILDEIIHTIKVTNSGMLGNLSEPWLAEDLTPSGRDIYNPIFKDSTQKYFLPSQSEVDVTLKHGLVLDRLVNEQDSLNNTLPIIT